MDFTAAVDKDLSLVTYCYYHAPVFSLIVCLDSESIVYGGASEGNIIHDGQLLLLLNVGASCP